MLGTSVRRDKEQLCLQHQGHSPRFSQPRAFFISISPNLHIGRRSVGDNLRHFFPPMRHLLIALLGLMRRRVWLLACVIVAAIVSIAFHSWTVATPILFAGAATYLVAHVYWV